MHATLEKTRGKKRVLECDQGHKENQPLLLFLFKHDVLMLFWVLMAKFVAFDMRGCVLGLNLCAHLSCTVAVWFGGFSSTFGKNIDHVYMRNDHVIIGIFPQPCKVDEANLVNFLHWTPLFGS